jgi:hypothetical protein
MLFECVMYISVFFIVLGLAFAALHRTILAHKAIRRNADDIAAALHAGEQWRADVRRAVAPLEQSAESEAWVITIPCAADSVVYRVTTNEVTRQTTARTAPLVLLQNVKASRVSPEIRKTVIAWRWELELQSTRAKAKVRPLFTFTAVPSPIKP